MFENAKANLEKSFVAFGLVERFDESLVLLKRRLGLGSVLYRQQRMTTERPRTAESKAELVPLAERFNSYDLRLYEWASQRFEQMVSEEGTDFLLDVAALRAALSKDHEFPPAPPATALSRNKLWAELMRARVELLGWEFDFAKSRVGQSEYEAKVAKLLGSSRNGSRVSPQAATTARARPGRARTAMRPQRKHKPVARADEARAALSRSAGSMTQKEVRLEEVREKIAAARGVR